MRDHLIKIAEHAGVTALAAFCTSLATGMSGGHASLVTLGAAVVAAAWQAIGTFFGTAGKDLAPDG